MRAFCDEISYLLVSGGMLLGNATNNEAELSSAYLVLHLLAKQLRLA